MVRPTARHESADSCITTKIKTRRVCALAVLTFRAVTADVLEADALGFGLQPGMDILGTFFDFGQDTCQIIEI